MSTHKFFPLVSVIIPAYNASAFIHKTLDSVLSQTYRNIEVIVVDDGSQDQTPEIVKSIAESDARVILLQQSNKGVAAARNLAISKSGGEYIAPIDADDIWHPQKIEKQVECMLQSEASVGLVYTWWVSIDEEGSLVYANHKWHVEGPVYEALLSLNFIGPASVPLIRRNCIERLGGYNSELKGRGGQGCEDWELSLRIAEHYELRVVPAYLVAYRSAKSSMSRSYASMLKSYELMIEESKQKHPEISHEIYRWSRSHFYSYMAEVSYRAGNYKGAIHWMYKALCSDQVAILSPWRAKLIIATLSKVLAKLITPLIRSDRHALWHFKKRSYSENRVNTTLPELAEDNEDKVFPWKPLEPFRPDRRRSSQRS